MFHCLDSHCSPGSSRPNEDAWGAGEGFAFVLDGATGLEGDGADAARTFAQGVAGQLMALLPRRELTLTQCLTQAAAQTAETGGCEGASASVLLVRAPLQGDAVEILSLGDCTLVLGTDREAQMLRDDRVPRLDQTVVEGMVRLAQQEGITVAQARQHPEIEGLLKANRARRNTPQGYWILDPTLTGIAHAQCRIWKPPQDGRLLLMTDGFAAALELAPYPDPAALLADCVQLGLDRVAQDLRRVQGQDADLSRVPRLKQGDDATAVLLR